MGKSGTVDRIPRENNDGESSLNPNALSIFRFSDFRIIESFRESDVHWKPWRVRVHWTSIALFCINLNHAMALNRNCDTDFVAAKASSEGKITDRVAVLHCRGWNCSCGNMTCTALQLFGGQSLMLLWNCCWSLCLSGFSRSFDPLSFMTHVLFWFRHFYDINPSEWFPLLISLNLYNHSGPRTRKCFRAS